MVDIVDPNVDAIDKVDLQVESTPGVYTNDIVYFCVAYYILINDPFIYLHIVKCLVH